MVAHICCGWKRVEMTDRRERRLQSEAVQRHIEQRVKQRVLKEWLSAAREERAGTDGLFRSVTVSDRAAHP